jgi:acyl CoA:acetate/3-ketoacid CoA transferase beta subunit
MDLAIGAKQTWVMMDLLTKQGQSKLVDQCSYPLTGIGCVKRVYTDLATLACSPKGLVVIDMVPGLTLEAFVATYWIASGFRGFVANIKHSEPKAESSASRLNPNW